MLERFAQGEVGRHDFYHAPGTVLIADVGQTPYPMSTASRTARLPLEPRVVSARSSLTLNRFATRASASARIRGDRMRVTATAASGLRSSMARFESSAATIAGSGLTDRPVTEAGAVAPVADVSDALESMMEAGLSYRANAKVLSAADDMIGSLIDRSA